MTTMLAQHIRTAAADEGVQITIWPCNSGYQVNVKEKGAAGWTVVTDVDPVDGLERALRQRLSRSSARRIVTDPESVQQVDAAIAARPTDDFEEFLA